MQSYTRRRLVKDFATIIGVLLLPLIVFFHLLFPVETESMNFLFFKIDSGYLESVQMVFWLAAIKLIHVITFLWWRATIKTWWRNILFLPALFFTWQFISCFDNTDSEFNSQKEFKYLIVFLIVAVIVIIRLVSKFKTYIRQKQTYNTITDENDELLRQVNTADKSSIIIIEKELMKLRIQKDKMNKNDYLRSLFVLKSKLEF